MKYKATYDGKTYRLKAGSEQQALIKMCTRIGVSPEDAELVVPVPEDLNWNIYECAGKELRIATEERDLRQGEILNILTALNIRDPAKWSRVHGKQLRKLQPKRTIPVFEKILKNATEEEITSVATEFIRLGKERIRKHPLPPNEHHRKGERIKPPTRRQ